MQDGRTALHHAAECDVPLAELVMRAHLRLTDAINDVDVMCATALDHAMSSGCTDVAALLSSVAILVTLSHP